MVSTSFFKQNLNVSHFSKAQILEKLSSLLGTVYLENNNQPVIGFLPQKYCIQQNNHFESFIRVDLDQYKVDQDIESVKEFVNVFATSSSHNFGSSGFTGGYIGYYDYNLAANFQINTKLKQQPQLFFGLYKTFLKFENNDWVFYSLEKNAQETFDLIVQFFNEQHQPQFILKCPMIPRWSLQAYRHAFAQVQNYILAGDCYQINLTQEFSAKAQGSLVSITEDFWQLTDAPYSAYLKVKDLEILSCSPELFIEFQENKKIITKPIKGTMPRYQDPELDQESKQSLANSVKDRAENLMIVDLLRNDLSIYAETGTVKTPKLFNIESFNQVHHMVSEITATLKSDVHVLNILESALPGGSITGAPKIRAMEIIEELELAPRGAYCGSMGYFNFDGTGSWNILIRTIQKHQDQVSIWAGGGITIASDCDAEYQECFDKVSAMLNLMNTWYKP